MYSITNKQRRLIYAMLIILFTIDIIIIIPGTVHSYKSDNFTEKISNAKEAFSSILSTASLFIAFVVMIMTQNSLEITKDSLKETRTSNDNTEEALRLTKESNAYTEKTLKLTEIEQQIRDIEKRLELFYFPMSEYFDIATGKRTKGYLTDSDLKNRIHAESYRYLANEDTRKKLDTWLIATEEKAKKQELLKTAIKKDIKKYQDDLTKLENDKKTLSD